MILHAKRSEVPIFSIVMRTAERRGSGSEFSLRHHVRDADGQFLLRQQPLEPGVLLFQLFGPFGCVGVLLGPVLVQPPVRVAPVTWSSLMTSTIGRSARSMVLAKTCSLAPPGRGVSVQQLCTDRKRGMFLTTERRVGARAYWSWCRSLLAVRQAAEYFRR